MKLAHFRFYEELNDFLPEEKYKKRFTHEFAGGPSIKDIIESLGVPHVEIDLIIVNGKSVDFNYIIKDGDDVSVYPVFESFDISAIQHLRPKPLRKKKFVLDVHLGTLAKYLRMLGFDTLYKNNYTDEEIIKLSLKENRVILTKDMGILKRKNITHGYFIRNVRPDKQLYEVTVRFDLKNEINSFSRCMECNYLLEKKTKEEIDNLIPAKVKFYHDDFYYCSKCNKVYWKGSHYDRMIKLIEKILSQ